MAVHHGKEGEVAIGGTGVGELTAFTLETTGDVVESTKMADAAKSFSNNSSNSSREYSTPSSNLSSLVIRWSYPIVLF